MPYLRSFLPPYLCVVPSEFILSSQSGSDLAIHPFKLKDVLHSSKFAPSRGDCTKLCRPRKLFLDLDTMPHSFRLTIPKVRCIPNPPHRLQSVPPPPRQIPRPCFANRSSSRRLLASPPRLTPQKRQGITRSVWRCSEDQTRFLDVQHSWSMER